MAGGIGALLHDGRGCVCGLVPDTCGTRPTQLPVVSGGRRRGRERELKTDTLQQRMKSTKVQTLGAI